MTTVAVMSKLVIIVAIALQSYEFYAACHCFLLKMYIITLTLTEVKLLC